MTACKFYGNCEMLQQVWINLLQNAIKFTPAGGMLSAKLVITGDKVRVSIRDTGVGMDDATMKRIFEKFYSGALIPMKRATAGTFHHERSST